MKFVFQKQALEEYREAAAYIAETSEQNSRLFIERVEATIDYILKHPDSNIRGRHGTLRRKIHRQSHWIVNRRLPSDLDTVEIIAIAHERRGEGYWEDRFNKIHPL
ncbi:ParE-like toxin of type II ParDE toxin-antitoxin system [Prosthecobacter fusiformis]|uniref:ParE-like toxin of type II ParDE toxin-antitoxin system n=1 Tax=Prosthecobacter fusiformis TaxID=48464 RepID=A0A4R7RP01_9BACT|nr:type II toxin-antitoxin system RelE/ParE family toxin [Prosthecobacter fusiformis]TDU67214.1 ParE-like toxin of type II ParDE toxin-antitoxin system [Prosthecobacter fusiformis]